ncbi:MAG TPA: hypothetical protein VJM10_00375, partial [Candidatus Methylomirabilis sp.]|nr:hypothetical protein [Candidatus Methylomirabilis sp.]
CPVTAIFPEAQVPEEWKFFTQKAIDYFAENTGVPPAKSKGEVGSGGVAEGSTHWVWKGQAAATTKAPAGVAATAAKAEPALNPGPAQVAAITAMVEAQPTPAITPVKAAVAATSEVSVITPSPAPSPESPAAPPTLKPAPEAPAPAKPPVKPAERPAAPPPPKPMDPDEYRRIEALLYETLEMLGGSRPFDGTVFSQAEETGLRLKKEVAVEFGKEVYTVSELEKRGIVLRQKHDLAQSLLQAVDRAQFVFRYRVRRRRFIHTAAGGAVTGLISALCGVLSLQTIRIDSLFTSPSPGLLELLRAFLNAESLIPFLAFQMIAGLLGLFTLFAIYQCLKVGKELHELRRAIQAKQMDPRMIARLA